LDIITAEMRYSFLILIFVCTLFTCTSKKKISTSDNTPNESHLVAVNTKYPGTDIAKLKSGYNIYNGSCTNCHAAKSIQSRSLEEWPKIIDRMAPKAKLNSDEKEAVFKYVMAVKLAAQ